MPGPRGTVIFDLDGTLVDSAPDLADTLDLVMEERGLVPFGLDGTRALIGHGIPALVRGAFGARGLVPEAGELDAATARFVDLYMGRLSVRTRPYPGAAEAVARLAREGWRLAVATNKREAAARAILADLGLLPAFTVVAGPDTFGVAKPDPRHLLGCLDGPGPAVAVGDSAIDVAAARAAGLPVVAVAWGYAREPAEALGADAVAQRFEEVPALVDRLAAEAAEAG